MCNRSCIRRACRALEQSSSGYARPGRRSRSIRSVARTVASGTSRPRGKRHPRPGRRSRTRPREAGYGRSMSTRVLILGAGFGGLELSTMLSEAFGDEHRGDADRQERRLRFRFLEARRDVRAHDARRGAAALQESRSPACGSCRRRSPRSIPSAARDHRRGLHEADLLVVALGADYDFDATPGLAEAATSSTPWPARRGWPRSSRRSPRAACSSASAARRSSARRRRARRAAARTTS